MNYPGIILLAAMAFILNGCGAAMAVHDSTQGRGEYSVNTFALISPAGWVIPGSVMVPVFQKPRTRASPYSGAKYSEMDDLKFILEKTSDGNFSTERARSAADRIFEYGSYRGKDRNEAIAYFPLQPFASDAKHLSYVFQTSVLIETYTISFGPNASFQNKKSIIRRKNRNKEAGRQSVSPAVHAERNHFKSSSF